MTHDRANPSGAITLLTILSSVTGGRVNGGVLGGVSRESGAKATDSVLDGARRE